jgi:hypothetical protein
VLALTKWQFIRLWISIISLFHLCLSASRACYPCGVVLWTWDTWGYMETNESLIPGFCIYGLVYLFSWHWGARRSVKVTYNCNAAKNRSYWGRAQKCAMNHLMKISHKKIKSDEEIEEMSLWAVSFVWTGFHHRVFHHSREMVIQEHCVDPWGSGFWSCRRKKYRH